MTPNSIFTSTSPAAEGARSSGSTPPESTGSSGAGPLAGTTRSEAPWWRGGLALALTAAAPVLVGTTADRLRSRLPDPLPTHWRGRLPDGFTAYTPYATTLTVAATAAAAVAFAAVLRPRGRNAVRRAVVVACAAAAWLAAGIWLATVGAALDAPDARSVELGGWLALGLAPAAVAALLAHLLLGRTPGEVAPVADGAVVPMAEIGATEVVVWTRRLTSPMLATLGALPLVGAGVALAVGVPGMAVALGLTGLVTTSLGSARVVVDRHGLTLRLGRLGWPRKRIPLAEMARASATTIEPLEWGGWGYRVTPGRSALVLRRGPGLTVDLVDGRRFAVTLDDPATPAGLLNALRARVGS